MLGLGPVTASVLAPRSGFGSIKSLLRCLLYRPLSTIPDTLTYGRDRSDRAFLLLNSKGSAQPRRLRVLRLVPWAREPSPTSRHIDCTKWARNLPLPCSSPLCLIAICRGMAHECRGTRRRPLDSRIKDARCAAVGRVAVHRLIVRFSRGRTLQESGLSLRSTGQRNVLGVAETSVSIEAMPDQSTLVKARALRARRRRLTALTSVACPRP
jgi:hypothetical protein